MSYQVLARKWRPANFGQLVGQSHILKTLSSALEQQRLHHAYLFTGTRGVGKTTIARIMARCLNCEEGVSNEPCGQCGACTEISEGRFVDLIEVDAASKTKIDDTRELLENVQYRPTRGRYKIYLIDEVHMLSKHSFNALLKTLEEPPPHVIFLLATTDPQMLPATVLSRCLQFHLKNMTSQEIESHLSFILGKEQVNFEPAAISAIAWSAKGSMRDSLSLLDQAIAYGNGEVKEAEVKEMLGSIDRQKITALLQLLAEGEMDQLLAHINDMDQYAPNYHDLLDEIIMSLHQIALKQQLTDYHLDGYEAEVLGQLANEIAPEDIQLFYQIALVSKRDLHLAPTAKTGLEMCLLRMNSFRPGLPEGTRVQGGPVQGKKSESSSVVASEPVLTEKKVPEQKAQESHTSNEYADYEHMPPDEFSEDIQAFHEELPHNITEKVVTEKPAQQAQPVPEVKQSTASSWDINSILRPKEESTPTSAPEPEPLPEVTNQPVPDATPTVDPIITESVEPFREPKPTAVVDTVIPEPEPEVVEQTVTEVEVVIPDETDNTEEVTLETINQSNWYQVVESITSNGITQQILLATQVATNQNGRLTLYLQSRLWNMLSAEQVNQISVLLHKRLGEEFSLSIETEHPTAETPGERRQRLLEEKYQAARDNLKNDPVVQLIEKTFDAHLDNSSVEPIN